MHIPKIDPGQCEPQSLTLCDLKTVRNRRVIHLHSQKPCHNRLIRSMSFSCCQK